MQQKTYVKRSAMPWLRYGQEISNFGETKSQARDLGHDCVQVLPGINTCLSLAT